MKYTKILIEVAQNAYPEYVFFVCLAISVDVSNQLVMFSDFWKRPSFSMPHGCFARLGWFFSIVFITAKHHAGQTQNLTLGQHSTGPLFNLGLIP